MPEDPKDGMDSQFLLVLKNFDVYVSTLVRNVVPLVEDPEDRVAAEALGTTATRMASTFTADAGELYRSLDGDVQQRMDTASRQMGGNDLVANMLGAVEKTAARAKGKGFWKNFTRIIEAIKKIIKDIMSVSLFGVSLNDLIGVAVNIDEIFRVLDNILQTIAGLFGGKDLQRTMYEDEVRNIEMEMKLITLKRLKFGDQRA